MSAIKTPAIEKMISHAYERGLILDYRLSPSAIDLVDEHGTTTLDPESARLYLYGLLEGSRPKPEKVGGAASQIAA